MVAACCYIVDVHSVRFHRCRADDPRGQLFTIDECSVGQVMNVQFAEVGWSQSYSPSANPPRCPWRNCTDDRTHSIAPMCNGHRSCSISQDLLIYSRKYLCALQRDANFIRIEYTCVAGMNSVFYCTAYYIRTVDFSVFLKCNSI